MVKHTKRACLLVSCLLLAAPAYAQCVIRVSVGQDLQAVFDTVTGPCEIRIAPGTYTATRTGGYTLRNVPGGTITIRPDVSDSLLPLPGARIDPSYSNNLFRLESGDGSVPLTTADGAHDYTIIGMEILPNTRRRDLDLAVIGTLTMTMLSQQPARITFDRCYLHGALGNGPTSGAHRGFMLNGIDLSVKNSYISAIWEPGRDSQAIAIANGTGPYLIENNYLEASGENFLVGGADPAIPDMVPGNIIFRGNYCFKPLFWQEPGYTTSVKNLFELKNAQNVTVENNVFENNWVDAQAGRAILFNVRNQDGRAPWSTVRNVTFQYNVVKNSPEAFSMLGLDDTPGFPSVRGDNIRIENNLIYRMSSSGLLVLYAFTNFVFEHNTMIGMANRFLAYDGPPTSQIYRNNVQHHGLYGAIGTNTAIGTPSIEAYAPGSIWTNNVIDGPSDASVYPYPNGNFVLYPTGTLNTRLDLQYRYTGPEPSTDGLPMGCNIDELRRRIPWYTGW